jgi:hypothetical protein
MYFRCGGLCTRSQLEWKGVATSRKERKAHRLSDFAARANLLIVSSSRHYIMLGLDGNVAKSLGH